MVALLSRNNHATQKDRNVLVRMVVPMPLYLCTMESELIPVNSKVTPHLQETCEPNRKPETEPESPKPNRLLKKPETGETGNNRNRSNRKPRFSIDPLTGHKVGQISSPRCLSTIFLINETRLFFLKGSRCSQIREK